MIFLAKLEVNHSDEIYKVKVRFLHNNCKTSLLSNEEGCCDGSTWDKELEQSVLNTKAWVAIPS